MTTRIFYQIFSFDSLTGHGVCTDGTLFEGTPITYHFKVEPGTNLARGDIISGLPYGTAEVQDVLLEKRAVLGAASFIDSFPAAKEERPNPFHSLEKVVREFVVRNMGALEIVDAPGLKNVVQILAELKR